MNMKTISIIITMLCAALMPVNAQETDTLVVEKPEKVIISTNADTMNIRIAGREGNPEYRYEKTLVTGNDTQETTVSSESRRSPLAWDFSSIENTSYNGLGFSFGIAPSLYAGFLMPLSKPDGMSTSFFRTYEAGVDNLLTLFAEKSNSRWEFRFGLGLIWKNITMTKSNRFVGDRDGNVSVEGYPEGTSSDHSDINLYGMTLTLGAKYRLYSDFYLGTSLLMEIYPNVHTTCESRYIDLDGKPTIEKSELTGIRRINPALRVDFASRFGGFFLKVNPLSVFKKGAGPQFSTVTFGLSLNF